MCVDYSNVWKADERAQASHFLKLQACNANHFFFLLLYKDVIKILFKEVFGIVVQFPSLQERAPPKLNGGKGCT
jgi:hypothetical protein